MRNTRTIEIGERVTISPGSRETSEGMVTENNPASSLIYVDGYPYERYKVERLDYTDPPVCRNSVLTLSCLVNDVGRLKSEPSAAKLQIQAPTSR